MRVVEEVKEGKEEAVELDYLDSLLQEVQEIRIQFPQVEELKQIIEEVQKFERKCQDYINQELGNNFSAQKISGGLSLKEIEQQKVDNQKYLKDILSLKSEVTELGVTTKVFKEFSTTVKPLLRWLHYTR
mmetsp:Transcript_39644/g.38202  ORF Transcript_39644/g.38202 Transcript_39644/m.38202 type:complete len:130 (-) Transcript_39644:18-407(-)